MSSKSLYKINPVPPNTARSTRSSIKAKTSWHEMSKCEKREAEDAASNFLNDLLNDVDTITTGIVFEKSSSCSVIQLYQTKDEASEDDVNNHEDRRLVNWKRWLEIRERDSKKIARATLRHRKELLLNLNPNDYRKIIKKKEIAEKSIFEAGDLNFWKLPTKSRQGLYATNLKSQRPEIVYTQTPDAILNEQKLRKSEDKTTIKLLKLINGQRKIKSIESHQPRMEKLALTGRELQVQCSNDSINEQIHSLQIPVRFFFENLFLI